MKEQRLKDTLPYLIEVFEETNEIYLLNRSYEYIDVRGDFIYNSIDLFMSYSSSFCRTDIKYLTERKDIERNRKYLYSSCSHCFSYKKDMDIYINKLQSVLIKGYNIKSPLT